MQMLGRPSGVWGNFFDFEMRSCAPHGLSLTLGCSVHCNVRAVKLSPSELPKHRQKVTGDVDKEL
jgi:hypothetical protein